MEEAKDILVLQASYTNPVHAEAICHVLNGYAQDPMGEGTAIAGRGAAASARGTGQAPSCLQRAGFRQRRTGGAGQLFRRFSTFACRPLVNVHDVAVMKDFRGLGLSQKMLQKVEDIARQRGCCKITLEVLGGNAVAQASYAKFGFAAGMFDPAHGPMEFWIKPL